VQICLVWAGLLSKQLSSDFLLSHELQLFLEDGALAATMRIYPAEEQQQLAWFVTGPATSGGGACELGLDNIVVYSMGSIWKA